MARGIKRTAWSTKLVVVVLLSVLSIVAAVLAGQLSIGAAGAKGDPPPPAPTITVKPSNPSYSTSASLSYTDTSSVSFSCQLDGSIFSPCGSGTSGSTSYSGLPVGNHTFGVKATSGAQTSGVTSYSWQVATPPAPSITAKPASLSFSGSAAFSYSDSVSSANFQCKLDTAPSFSSCPGTGSGSTSYPGLANGSHTFSVRAVTDPLLISPATSYTWTVDLPPPAPAISSHPADPTNQQSASFGFSDTQGGVTFKCSLDGSPFGPCTSPKAYNNLNDGSHTFQVEALDSLGATSSPASFTWAVNTKPPKITLDFPNDNGLYTADEWNAGCPSPGYCGTASDPVGVQQVQLSIQQVSSGKYWNGTSFVAGQTFVTAPNTSWSYGFTAATFPADGDFTVNVRATDNAGNTTPAAQYVHATLTIDRTPPPAPTLKKTPGNPTTDTHAHFEYQDSEPGVKFQCSLDGATYTNCGDHKDYDHLAQGSHTFCVEAIDKAGNASSATCFTWVIGAGLANLTVSGNATGLLYPAGPAQPIGVTFTNPNSVAVTITSLTITLVPGSFPLGCSSGDFQVNPSNVSASHPITVPAGGSVTLPDSVNAPGVTAPTIQMNDSGSDQYLCKGATFSFTYSIS
jgi:hypothetical protein